MHIAPTSTLLLLCFRCSHTSHRRNHPRTRDVASQACGGITSGLQLRQAGKRRPFRRQRLHVDEIRHIVRVCIPPRQRRQIPLALKERQHRCMIMHDMRHILSCFRIWRDQHGWNPEPITIVGVELKLSRARHGLYIIGCQSDRGRDVIVKSAVLVVDIDKCRFVPQWRSTNGIDNLGEQALADGNILRWLLALCLAILLEERKLRKSTSRSVSEEIVKGGMVIGDGQIIADGVKLWSGPQLGTRQEKGSRSS